MATEREFASIVALLEAAFGTQPAMRHDVYFEILEGYPCEELKVAALRCVTECKSYPVVKDLLERIPGYVAPRNAAKLAWMKALEAATEGPTSYNPITGSIPTGQYLDDITLATVGGIAGLCRILAISADAKALSWEEKAFCDRYEAVTSHDGGCDLVLASDRKPLASAIAAMEPRLVAQIIADRFPQS